MHRARRHTAGQQLFEVLGPLNSVDEILANTNDPRAMPGLMLKAIAGSESARRTILNRSFQLGELYGRELDKSREQLAGILEDVKRWQVEES